MDNYKEPFIRLLVFSKIECYNKKEKEDRYG